MIGIWDAIKHLIVLRYKNNKNDKIMLYLYFSKNARALNNILFKLRRCLYQGPELRASYDNN